MDKAQLLRRLAVAFSDVVRDESFTLHEAQLADQSLGRIIPEGEYSTARALDTHTKWEEIPSHFLEECDAALSHLTPEGWHFYMAAYIRRALELIDRPICETFLPGQVVFQLTLLQDYPGIGPYKLKRFRQLSESQTLVVRDFLKYVETHASADSGLQENATLALNSYWCLSSDERFLL